MENKDKDSVLAFDTLFTTNSIQILKILLPCLPSRMQQFLAVYIKYLELQYTLQYFRSHPVFSGGRQKENTPDLMSVYPEIKGYLSPEGRAQFEQLASLVNTMQTVQEMKSMMDMMNAFTDTGTGSGGSSQPGSADPVELLKGMLSPEQQAMFDMFRADT